MPHEAGGGYEDLIDWFEDHDFASYDDIPYNIPDDIRDELKDIVDSRIEPEEEEFEEPEPEPEPEPEDIENWEDLSVPERMWYGFLSLFGLVEIEDTEDYEE